MNRRFRHNSQGVALITAMLIVALATIAAVAVTSRQQFDIRRSANLINGEQSYQFALGAESFAVQVLADDLKNGKAGQDTLEETWAQPFIPQSIEGGQLTGRIEDLQGRFNINNLGDPAHPKAVESFQRLLDSLDIPNNLVFAVIDWIDTNPDVDIRGGAEDGDYLSLPMPYRAANRPLGSASELLLINGFKPEYYIKLEPYVCALPTTTSINVNTAAAPVLAALSAVSPSGAEQMVDDRKQNPYDSVAKYQSALQSIGGLSQADVAAADPNVGVDSSYFLVIADTLFGKGRTRLFSELHRIDANTINVTLRAQGVL